MSKKDAKQQEQTTPHYYIGLMCGTSIDGVDVALVDFSGDQCRLVASYLHPIDNDIKANLRSLCSLSSQENHLQHFEHRIELLGELDQKMGAVFADSVNCFFEQHQESEVPSIQKDQIIAIGSHGQTIRHQPALNSPFTIQIGDPNVIAYQTGITTVSDFRRMDIAVGGQGAPLAPAFHNAVMRTQKENRIILNLGGIANISLLPKDLSKEVIGFDTGTANTLLDVWFLHNHPEADCDFDKDSQFALQGKVQNSLLKQLLKDPYFELPPPKSTGREYFSIEWLWQQLNATEEKYEPADIQRTLLEFTAITISDSIQRLDLDGYKVFTCGGGTHNNFLIERIQTHVGAPVLATDSIGISGDYLEAMTFAWLARQRIMKQPGNLPSVTGASEAKVLGAVYHP
ncbi:anhydro-N-acetylmuramic acid kinase [Aliikangiella coralliicola]|uniref:Anhydro-N-acetylmuramic acid kinase n=1 Tax=Aliikangiella coralliicola TaxID=2592383 RepID=A0A545U742_9GAMM|nr:anhydro-N-acetylmuramic acid kinase [Aliikangiella coralliicola]TQV85277.1 anhydro-N-acetylmuramic acid kinase [Aliikangiella coralliicola]